jgi:hypothetical protein
LSIDILSHFFDETADQRCRICRKNKKYPPTQKSSSKISPAVKTKKILFFDKHKITLLYQHEHQLFYSFLEICRALVAVYHLVQHTRYAICLNNVLLNFVVDFEIVETEVDVNLARYIRTY